MLIARLILGSEMGGTWGEIYTEPIKAFKFHFSLAKYVCEKSRFLIYYWHLVNKVGVKESPLFCLCVGCNLVCVSQGFSKDTPNPVLPERQGWVAGLAGKISGRVGGALHGVKGEAPQPSALCLSLPQYLRFYHHKVISLN